MGRFLDMKAERQVCTIHQARRLVELGAFPKTYFQWEASINRQSGELEDVCLVVTEIEPSSAKTRFPAPTVAELGELLPSVVGLEDEDYYIQGSLGKRKGEFHYIWFQSSLDNVEWELFPAVEKDTEAEARAEALIWLIENKFIGIEDFTEDS